MNSKQKNICISIMQSFLTLLAFCSSTTAITHEQALALANSTNAFSLFFAKLQLNYTTSYGVNSSIVFLLLCYFFYRINSEEKNKRLTIYSSIGALIFTTFTIIGNRFLYNINIFMSKSQVLITIINAFGYFFMFKNMLIFLFSLLEKRSLKKEPKKGTNRQKLQNKIFQHIKNFKETHPVIFFFILFLICWLPYIIIFYPGTLNCDALVEIHQYWGKIHWTTHHPILPTIIYGSFMDLGKSLLNDNFGLFLNNISQVLVGSLTLSIALNYTYKIVNNKKAIWIIFAFFAFLPTWPIHFYSEVKDIWFSISFLIYILFTMSFIKLNGKFNIKQWIGYILSMMFIYFFRNNGVFVILLTLPFLVIIAKKIDKVKILSFSILTIVICSLLTKFYMSKNNITKGSIVEALAIPLQQSALYINSYELTGEEYTAINNIIDVNYFKELYNPEIVDDIKAEHKEITSDSLKSYLITWFKMFFKHPNIYLKATLNASYGYFYPNRIEYKDGIAQFTIDSTGRFVAMNVTGLNLHHIDKTADLRNIIYNFTYMLRNMPLIGLLFSCGFYTWFLIVLTLVAIYFKQKKDLIILVPLYVIFLVCIASPVNAYVRYMLPIMISIPFISAWQLQKTKKGS